MMEGIEVLSVGSIGINQVFNWNAAIVGGLFFGIVLGIWFGLSTDSVISGCIGFLIMSILLGVLFGVSVEKYADTVSTYKVTISDDIKLNEFYERYEILEQEGKIFTIKEKTEDGSNSLPAS